MKFIYQFFADRKKRFSMSYCLLSYSIFAALLVNSPVALSDEGMWQPHQLPAVENRLKELGLSMPVENLTDLAKFPMNAIVSLGGCSASFVSPKGLVVTNHHCVYGSVQFNSTDKNNLFRDGFLAKSFGEELPAAPGTRVYVTESLTNVTEDVLNNVSDDLSGKARYEKIETNIKALVKDCEKSGMHRCDVPSFHHGFEYYLIKRLEIRDVRLVYAPKTSIGKFGGDIDNWMWPRHTGDFGFYRAYVGPDGKPADFDKEKNVPYQSKSYLSVSAKSLRENDFVMAAGYPGRTNRYRTSREIEHQFTWYYPNAREVREELIQIIKDTAGDDESVALKYENTLAGLANYAKNFQSMVESYNKSDFLDQRKTEEKNLHAWFSKSDEKKSLYAPAVADLDKVILSEHATKERDLILGYMRYVSMLTASTELYRWSLEQEKPDAEREPGYQERDRARFEQFLKRISRRYDADVDLALLEALVHRYAQLSPEQRLPSVDAFFDIDGEFKDQKDRVKFRKRLTKLYTKTDLDSESERLKWMSKPFTEFDASKDPFIQYAVSTFAERKNIEDNQKELTGLEQASRARYMEALLAYNRDIGRPIYADANSTLRVTFGEVAGNEPRDGLHNKAFTKLEGILEKHTDEDPFDVPEAQIKLINEKKYGKYFDKELGSVPVNFLCTLDITGGNSGSAVMNGNGELVGLLFDGVYESIIGDWFFDDAKNRAIAVDSRYMLWVMEFVDGADNLIKEMNVVY